MPVTTETALVKITTTPIRDPAYENLSTEIQSLCQHINNAVVDSPEAVARITTDVNLGQKIANQVEALRKQYKEEPIRIGKQIDAAFKVLSNPIEKARSMASQKIRQYNDEQREKRRTIDAENARKAREAAELQKMIDEENARLRAEAEKSTVIDQETGEIKGPEPEYIKPEPEPEYIPSAPIVQKVTTDLGSATEKMIAKFKLVDIKKVPRNLLLLNEKAVNAMLEAGIRQIDGLEIWEDPEIKFRSK